MAKRETDKETEAPAAPLPPRVGSMVFYTNTAGLVWPAIVSEIDLMAPMVVGLTVFSMTGPVIADVVSYDEGGALGTWRWGELVLKRAS